jgi:MoxR-like ATPase
LECDYLEHVITSRTAAEDLKWRFDAVRRLRAPENEIGGEHDRRYVTPGVLWDAFEPDSAREIRAYAPGRTSGPPAMRESYGNKGAVVLLDEIDKADPDVPNDLLVTLDQRSFYCTDLDQTVKAADHRKVLVLITSNQERELPRAFLRRCIVTTLPRHDTPERRAIAALHRPGVSEFLLDRIDTVFERIDTAARSANLPLPSTAEYLDAVSACLGLDLTGAPEPGAALDPVRDQKLKEALEQAVGTTLWKSSTPIGDVLPPQPSAAPRQ